jgi:hypothetical protein
MAWVENWPLPHGRDFIHDDVLSTSNKYQLLELTVAGCCAAPVRAGGTDRHSKLPSRLTSRLARPLLYQANPDIEFLDITLRKDSSILLHDSHIPFYWWISLPPQKNPM